MAPTCSSEPAGPGTVRGKRYHLAERVGNLSKAGRVKLVFSRRPGEKRWIALATNETRWSVQMVLGQGGILPLDGNRGNSRLF